MPDNCECSEGALELRCPTCGAIELDEFEVIEARTLTQVQCCSCHASFAVWMEDCQHCGEEVLVTLPAGAQCTSIHMPEQCPACLSQGAFHEIDDAIADVLS